MAQIASISPLPADVDTFYLNPFPDIQYYVLLDSDHFRFLDVTLAILLPPPHLLAASRRRPAACPRTCSLFSVDLDVTGHQVQKALSA